MKTGWKIIITIALAALCSWMSWKFDSPTHEIANKHKVCRDLKPDYDEFNSKYFEDKLPANVIIDWSEHVVMASTDKMPNGQFRISFNEKYNLAERTTRETLLHEQCHVRTWRSIELQSIEDIQTGQHGRRWRTCMLGLDLQGAFRREIIDYYEGQ